MNPYICPATIKAHVLETWLEIQACNTRTYWPNETAISSKGHEPDNIVSHKSLKLSFANIQVFRLILNLSLNQTILIILLYVRPTWMTLKT